MSKYNISDETKFKEGRCMRLGKYWIAWIKANEFSSLGTRAIIIDWKTGRQVHCLSLGERAWYLIKRWDDEIIDINEQVVLYKDSNHDKDPPLIGTTEIADILGIKAVNGGRCCTTSDFRVFHADGRVEVVSFKSSEAEVNAPKNERLRERLRIEEAYWKYQTPSVSWSIQYRSDINFTYANNIDKVVRFYNKDKVFDDVSNLKHLIATKQIIVDMEKRPLEFGEMIRHGI